MYVGVTSDLLRRVKEHIEGKIPGFTEKYNVHKLVYYEVYVDIDSAIQRESRLKSWKREWKDNLVSKVNPSWKDLFPLFDERNPSVNLTA